MPLVQLLRKWGNGTGLRLPKQVLDAAGLAADQPVEVSLRGRSVVLTPVETAPDPRLADLLAGVTPALIGGELEWGADLGGEAYE